MGQLNVSYPVRPREYLTDGDREVFFFCMFLWVQTEHLGD